VLQAGTIERIQVITALLLCTVIGISDGDTLTVRCPQQSTGWLEDSEARNIRVRLADIDAPEKSQPFGQRSKQHLAALCFQKQAEVMPQARLDRYGRTVAHVRCDGQDANAAQVKAGMAWVYGRYAPQGSHLMALQASAMHERLGLWSDDRPVPPWDWRRLRRVAFTPQAPDPQR